MQLAVIGIHQRQAPIEVREQATFTDEDLPRALHALKEVAREGAILSTCHRTEVYAVHESAVAAEAAARRFLEDWYGARATRIEPHLYAYHERAAVRHLFRLTAGLESVVLGEDQILAQVKAAFDAARAGAGAGPSIHRLFEAALAAGKLVRTRTNIARGHLSAVSLVLDLARQAAGSLAGVRVLVVGAGASAELVLQHLRAEQPERVTVTNRTTARAAILAERYGARAVPLDQLACALAATDLVLSCTSAPDVLISAAMVAQALRQRADQRPLVLCDLAVPRDIDPAAGALPGVRLFDVDSLHELAGATRARRAAEVEQAAALVEKRVDRFMRHVAERATAPTIRALRAHAEAIRAAELERALARLPNLSPHQRETLEDLTGAIVNKLLHQPMVRLKDPATGRGLAQAAHLLFDLPPTTGEPHAVQS